MMLEKRILQIYQPGWKAFKNCKVVENEFAEIEGEEFQSDCLKIENGWISTGARALLYLNFTGYEKLVVTAKAHGRYGEESEANSTFIGYMIQPDGDIYAPKTSYTTAPVVYEIDISKQRDWRYICLKVDVFDTMYIYDIHLE